MTVRRALWLCLAMSLSACASAPARDASPTVADTSPVAQVVETPSQMPRSPYPAAQEDPSKRGDYVAGGLYAPQIPDSAPEPIADIDAIPEPEVRAEPRSRVGNRSYSVLGKTYRIRDKAEGYVEEGRASFYGKKFHGRLTSNQEVYDMYAMTAAHRSLPLPSYVRVTNLDNGKSVVVRVNDRGPFHAGRIIDLSYAAATKLGFIKQGTARVEVRALTPGDERGNRGKTSASEPAAAKTDSALIATVEDRSVPADEFERWMQTQGIRFATGRTGDASAAQVVATTTASPAAVSAQGGDAVLLQLASFSGRDNAERALVRLRESGIEGARLDEASVNGQTVWRLRLGPVAAADVTELSARCADLGFESAHIVRE